MPLLRIAAALKPLSSCQTCLIGRFNFFLTFFIKGFYFSFPLEIFFSENSRGRTYFGLKPLTRDGGARLIRALGLYGVTDQGYYNALTRDWDDLYD